MRQPSSSKAGDRLTDYFLDISIYTPDRSRGFRIKPEGHVAMVTGQRVLRHYLNILEGMPGQGCM